jgi:hypothetical protein
VLNQVQNMDVTRHVVGGMSHVIAPKQNVGRVSRWQELSPTTAITDQKIFDGKLLVTQEL